VRVFKKAQAKVHPAREQRLGHLVLVDGAHLHAHLGVLLGMPEQQGGQEFVADGWNRRQPHCSLLCRGQVACCALQGIQLTVDVAGLHGQHLRFRCGREACRGAIEQPVSQLELCVRNGLADGGGGDAQQARGSAHAARLQHGLKDFDLAQIHADVV